VAAGAPVSTLQDFVATATVVLPDASLFATLAKRRAAAQAMVFGM
jgi:hypothetical protein